VLEFRLRNVTASTTIHLSELEFLMNRSRIFFKTRSQINQPYKTAATSAATMTMDQGSMTPLNPASRSQSVTTADILSAASPISPSASPRALPEYPSISSSSFSSLSSSLPLPSSAVAASLTASQPSPPSTESDVHPRRSVHFLPLSRYFDARILAPTQLDGAAIGMITNGALGTSTTCADLTGVVLQPGEQLNLLCFIRGPRSVTLAKELETLIRELLRAHGSISSATSLNLASTPLPYRTPFCVRYHVEGAGEQKMEIVCQNKTVWRSVPSHHTMVPSSATAAVPSSTVAPPARADSSVLPPPFASPNPSAPLPSPSSPSIPPLPPSKLSIRLHIRSPLVVARTFVAYVSVRNHSLQATGSSMELRLLPASHPIVQKAEGRRTKDGKDESAHATSDSADRMVLGQQFSVSPLCSTVVPFSPSSPSLPLLFSPCTPFTPNTPATVRAAMDAAAATAAAAGAFPGFDPLHPFSSSAYGYGNDLPFPFRVVEHLMGRRHSSASAQSKTALQDQQQQSSTLSSLHQSTEAYVHTASLAKADHESTASTLIARQGEYSSSGQMLTTALSSFLVVTDTDATGTHGAVQPLPDREVVTTERWNRDQSNAVSVSSLLCQESSVSLGSIPPHSERTATFHFMPLREGVVSLSTLFLYDGSTHTYYRPLHPPALFVLHA